MSLVHFPATRAQWYSGPRFFLPSLFDPGSFPARRRRLSGLRRSIMRVFKIFERAREDTTLAACPCYRDPAEDRQMQEAVACPSRTRTQLHFLFLFLVQAQPGGNERPLLKYSRGSDAWSVSGGGQADAVVFPSDAALASCTQPAELAAAWKPA